MSSVQFREVAGAERAHQAQPERFVPGEVCLVTETLPGAAGPSYEVTQRHINEAIRRLPADGGPVAKSVFGRDLRPLILRKYIASGVDVLLPLELPGGTDGAPARSIQLPATRAGGPSTSLHFYRLPDATDPRLVKEVVDQVNLYREGSAGGSAGQGVRVLAATPNWLAAGAQEFTDCGPGARPEPAQEGTWDWHFSNDGLVRQLATGKGKNVVVAVLDTCPRPEVVAEAVEKRGNRLLTEVAGSVKLDSPPSLSQAYFDARLPMTVAGWQGARPTRRADLSRFLMPDHGFFVAGLVRDIVPDAEIHIVRVMNDYGVGDMLGLSWAMSRLPQTFLLDPSGRPNEKRLVVNLSLMLAVPAGVSVRSSTPVGNLPPSNAFLSYWFPEASRTNSYKQLRRHLELQENRAVAELIKDTHVGLQSVVASLTSATDAVPGDPHSLAGRQLLVAAAGNDNRPGQRPPGPRLPARYDDVVGVASVNRKLGAAKYSNLGDQTVLGNGVAVFGGDAAPGPLPSDPNLIDTAPPPGSVDAVVGVFSSGTFPPISSLQTANSVAPPPQNLTGWAYWAGTSFATPIISALAASIWSSDPGKSPPKVMSDVIGYADSGNQLAAPVIEADQVR
jgi:hypothetical protein